MMRTHLPVQDPPTTSSRPARQLPTVAAFDDAMPPGVVDLTDDDATDHDALDETGEVREPQLDFETFYRDGYAAIARALTATLGDLDLAQEATDEAMVRAFVRWEKIRGYDNPGGWVYRVGLNWARSARRRLTRKLPFHERHVVDAPVTDPAHYAALRDLDIGLRAVVVCRLLLDWSVDDTATALRIKPGTVKSRLHRALAQLEHNLGDAS
jgi:DNA-directed RNA polymerase specialized sigma24 family protein